jgi:DNA-binding CsgD family transcriptional regulator
VSQDEVRRKEITIGRPIFGYPIEPINGPQILSRREKQIFFLSRSGLERKEICQALNIKRENLKKHLQNINKKILPDF